MSATFNKLIQPDFPEARSTSFMEGRIAGWIPGEISSLDDPEKLGRVKVRCEIIQEGVDLPNSNDSYVWVLEDFVPNAIAGGSHRLLKVGAQVALLPMFGDPKQMLLLGCIPSRVDRPSPELDRSKGIYGHHTPGQVIVANNDNDASRIEAYPHGVIEHVSGAGDKTTQTREGAKMQLSADGTVRSENKFGSTVISSDGILESRNAAGGVSTLSAKGDWEIKSTGKSKLTLESSEARMEGPLNELSALMQKASAIPGKINSATSLLAQVDVLGKQFELQGSTPELSQSLDKLLQSTGAIVNDGLPQDLKILQKIGSADASYLGESLIAQAQHFIDSGLAQVAETVTQMQAKSAKIKDIIQRLKQTATDEQIKILDSPDLDRVLAGLNHVPKMQLQAILAALAPNGFESIQNIIGLGLHSNIGKINDFFTNLVPRIQQAVTQNAQTISVQSLHLPFVQELNKLLPSSVKHLFGNTDVESLLQVALTGGNPMLALLGKSTGKIAIDLASNIAQSIGLGKAIAPLRSLTSLLTGGNVGGASKLVESVTGFFPEIKGIASTITNVKDIAKKFIPKALSSFTSKLGGLFGGGKSKSHRFLNSLSGNSRGGVVRATGNLVEVKADTVFPSAAIVVSKAKAALRAAGGAAEIFAGLNNAGISSPHGSISFGSDGGLFSTIGSIIQEARTAAAHPDRSRLVCSGNNVSLQFGTTEKNFIPKHQLRVDKDGVWANDINLLRVWDYWYRRFDDLETRLNLLISSQ